MSLKTISNFDVENLNALARDTPLVYIANKSGHDFSASEKYGKPCFITKGVVDRFAIQNQARLWMTHLCKSSRDDFILITSMSILTAVGCAIFGWLHGRINVLLFKNNKYVMRTILFQQLLDSALEKEAL